MRQVKRVMAVVLGGAVLGLSAAAAPAGAPAAAAAPTPATATPATATPATAAPAAPTAPGAGGLPAGHPDLAPSAAVPGLFGVLEIKAVQGTAGGAPPAGDAVRIDYYDTHGHVVSSEAGKLNDAGAVTSNRVPLTGTVQPLITVTHAGVEYRAPANPMDGRRRHQKIELTVHDVTDQEPAWQLRMRHIIVKNSAAGLAVTEMLSVQSPVDKTWLGKRAKAEDKPVSMVIPLPAGAADVQFGAGFEASNTAVVEGKLVHAGPIYPGNVEYQVQYTIAAKDGAAMVSLVAPAPTGNLLVFLPDDGTTVTSDQLKKMDPSKTANLRKNSRFFTADAQKAGDRVAFMVSGLSAVRAPVEEAAGGATVAADPVALELPGIAKMVGAWGAAAILFIGSIAVLLAPRKE